MLLAASLVALTKAYLLTGLVVSVAFLLFGLDRLEPQARGAYGFRPLILPGLVLLWPLVLWRWAHPHANQPALPHPPGVDVLPRTKALFSPTVMANTRVHKRAWLVLAIVLPLCFIAAMSFRQVKLPDQPVQRISPPTVDGLK